MFVPVSGGGQAGLLFEKAAEGKRIFVTDGAGDVLNGKFRRFQQFFCFIQAAQNQVFLWGIAGRIFKKSCQIGAVQSAVLCEVLNLYRFGVLPGDIMNDFLNAQKGFLLLRAGLRLAGSILNHKVK